MNEVRNEVAPSQLSGAPSLLPGGWRMLMTTLTLSIALTTGCRTYMPYVGRPMSDTAEAMTVIRELLEQQPGSNAALQIEVSEQKFHVVRTYSNWFLGTSGVSAPTIYYASIGGLRLSHKGSWYAVTIDASNGVALLHVFAPDQATAERFIDALDTMRQAAAERGPSP